jgi:hypothetical protein
MRPEEQEFEREQKRKMNKYRKGVDLHAQT